MGWWPFGGAKAPAPGAGEGAGADTKPASGCPVMHSRGGGAPGPARDHPLTASACPVPEDARREHPMILLDPRLDRSNNMLAGGESQYPGLGQKMKLPTERVQSSIPRSDEHTPAHQEGAGYAALAPRRMPWARAYRAQREPRHAVYAWQRDKAPPRPPCVPWALRPTCPGEVTARPRPAAGPRTGYTPRRKCSLTRCSARAGPRRRCSSVACSLWVLHSLSRPGLPRKRALTLPQSLLDAVAPPTAHVCVLTGGHEGGGCDSQRRQ